MKWHSLLKNPNDLPQRINRYEESEDVMVVERFVDTSDVNFKFVFHVLKNPCYYGHWEPNGEEGWRVRGKDLSDCGKFGGFDTDTHYREYEHTYTLTKDDFENLSKNNKEFILNNCKFDENIDEYITRSIVGWTYFPNVEEFIEENKDLL